MHPTTQRSAGRMVFVSVTCVNACQTCMGATLATSLFVDISYVEIKPGKSRVLLQALGRKIFDGSGCERVPL
jgi:hypothetical protein